MDQNRKSFTPTYSLVQATYWMTACAVLSYTAVYLQALSFSNFALGVITAAGRVLGSLLGPVIASYLDSHPRFPTAKMNTPLLFLQIILFAILQFTGSGNLITAVLVALVIGLFISTNSVVLRFCGDCAASGIDLNFGIARGVGSFAYIIPSVLLGIVFKYIPAAYLPVFGILLLVVQIVVNGYAGRFFVGQRSISMNPENEQKSSSLLQFFREEPVFTRLLFGIMLLFFGYYTYATFLINVVRNLGGDTSGMGFLSGVSAAIEIPFMFAFARLRKKWHLSSILTLSVIAISLKILASALVTDMTGLYVSQLLQGPGYALFAAAIVVYVSKVIPAKNLAKGQSLVYTMEMASGVLAGLIAGKLYDTTSVKITLLAGFAVTAAGVILCVSGIKKVR